MLDVCLLGTLHMPATIKTASAQLSDLPEVDGLINIEYYDQTELTYSFTALNDRDYAAGGLEVTELSDTYQAMVLKVYGYIENVINLTFSEVSKEADTAFVQADLIQINAGGLATGPVPEGNSVVLSTSEEPVFETVMHEILHSLGLVHPDSNSAFVDTDFPVNYKSSLYTGVIDKGRYSYEHEAFLQNYSGATGLLVLDIEALQLLYGANTEPTEGDNTYVFQTDEFYHEGLYDSGGTDTIRIIDNDAKGVTIDLSPRQGWDVGSSFDYGADSTENFTVHTTIDTIIENVRGGDGNDELTGNSADNLLVGGVGNDSVYGGDGNDTMWAGRGDEGDDLVNGQAGDDIVGGAAGNDTLIGGAGNDTLFAGSGNDLVYVQNQVAHDNVSSDTAWAGSGNDTLYGSDGANRLGLSSGDDLVYSYGGDDIIYANVGDDTIYSGSGNDLVYGGDDEDFIDAGSGDDEIYGGDGSDTIEGGTGNDLLYGGLGNDTLTGGAGNDSFNFKPTSNMTITDFVAGEDTIVLELSQIENYSQVQDSMEQSGSDVRITIGSDVILVNDITVTELDNSENFVI